MQIRLLGTGDAFGAGGRLNTCFHVKAGDMRFLIDCGATSLVALKRAQISTNDIDMIFISHLHGDHFGGLPFFLIDARYVARREAPLTIVGPAGIEARFRAAAEALFPGVLDPQDAFTMNFVEWRERERREFGAIAATPFEVRHLSGAPPYALRFEIEGKTLAFTGDTGWTDAVIEAGHGADLYIMECYQYDTVLNMHLDYMAIARHFDQIGAKQIILTHMGEEMLARRGEIDTSRCQASEDGMLIEL